MTQPHDYALLAAASYADIRLLPDNQAPIPPGWTELTQYAISKSGGSGSFLSSGLSARVYQGPGGEIVISLAGTEFAASAGAAADFLSGNIPMAFGRASAQAYEAAQLYQKVKADQGQNITFTGHSLGGGMASVMAVWFNQPAYVFAPAPFQASADATQATTLPDIFSLDRALPNVRFKLGSTIDPALASYNPATDFATREAKVQAWAVKGEVLEATLGGFNWIESNSTKLLNNSATQLGMLSRHSIDLHAAALLSKTFDEWAAKLPSALPLIFDGSLYGFNPLGNQRDFLIKLNRNEVGVAGIGPNGMLSHFASDLQKLGTNIQGLNQAAQDALIAQGIEWYYWQGTDYAGQEFFTQTGESLQYTIALGAGLANAQNKAASYVGKWLTPIVKDHGESYSVSFARDYDQWNIATGSAGASLTALKSDKSQIFIGGAGGDSFTGGNLDDVMFAGAGADTLDGGAGNDELYGGANNDTLRGGAGYDIYRIEGDDTIEDSDGFGIIKAKNGNRITGAIEKRSDGSYVFLSDPTITVAGGADLKLTLADGSGVTIKNFQSGDLGLHLNDTAATTETSRTILGDLAPVDFNLAEAGVQSRSDELGNVIVDANKPEANRRDYLYDSAGNDDIRGYGGDDYIEAGRGGDDRLDGGTGNDIIAGRAGDDIVIGGTGADLLRGDAGRDKLYAGSEVTLEAALVAENNAASGLKGDFLDGGTEDDVLVGDVGNDAIAGGASDDILLGGSGDDNIWGDLETSLINQDWAITRSVTTQGDTTIYTLNYSSVFANAQSGGGSGDDTIFAGAGADWVMAEDGDDYIDGGAGDDVLFGQRGRDDIFGGIGNDHLIGDSGSIPLAEHGDDYLDGEEGDDRLSGDGGNDQLFGGAGNDQLYGGEGEDYLDGEEGDDILVGGAEGDVLLGGNGADYLQGDAGNGEGDGNDYLDGGAGDDILLGLGGQDELYGGDGADQIVGDNGGTDTSGAADTIYGGAGNDVIYGQGGDDVIDAGADNDLVVGGSGNDLIDGGTGDDQLQGGEGNDTLAGGEGSDMLFGESGNDTLQGGAGTDYLLGGLGDDSLDGGEGDDVYYYTSGEGNDRISDSGGTDWLVFNDIYWGQVQLGVGSMKLNIPGGEIHLDDFDADNPYAAGGIEYFQFADGTVMSKAQLINAVGFTPTGTPETDVLSGTALADTIRALAGDDVVTARGGNDIVYGGAGNDVLLGEAGDDTLYGEAGIDLLSGGAGNDLLMGGDGDDSYLFQAGDGQDTVTDAQGQNAIVLGAGLTLGAIIFGRQGNDLFVAIKNTTDRLTVKDWFATESHFASVMLGDGSVLDRAGVDAAMPTNQAPLTMVDSVTVIEDDLLTASGNALANDSDPEDRVLRVTNPGSYAGTVGTLTLSSNGAYSYSLANGSEEVQSLAAGQSLTEQYAYTVTDDDPNGAATAESAIVVTVLGNNDLPVLGFDSAATAEDASPISGNVLDNDHDIDVGTTLTVANAGTHSGSYGTLELGSDGAWRYSLANSSSAVQSLAAGQMVTERFDFNVSDGITTVGGALSIAVAGQNDAPILVAALADQSAAANTSWSWQLPANSFADADAGDVLTYGATLADGTALPSWLAFDAATQTFSGRVPKSATGNVDIRVAATDLQGVNAADVFTLNFSAGTGGGGGGGGNNGGGSTGNEGIGNGVDGPPPGHDTSFNDGPGTSPGNPGAQGGNGFRPPRREDIEMAQVQIASATVQAPVLAAVHGSSANAHAEAPDQVKAAAIGNPGDGGAATQPTGNNQTFSTNSRNDASSGNPRDMDTATDMSQTDTAGQSAETQTPWLTSAAWASLGDQGAVGSNGNGVAAFARWLAVEQALARESANAGVLPAWLDSTQGADLSGLLTSNGGLPDPYQSLGVDTFGLRVGSGLQVFKGLGNGVQQIM